jgi:SAM-dependent methyltransferase
MFIMKPGLKSLINRLFSRNRDNSKVVSDDLNPNTFCCVCGGTDFTSAEVLWQELIDDWQINPEETVYINRQQGTACRSCGNNLRSLAIAKAILAKYDFRGTLREFFSSDAGSKLRVLSINTSGGLSPAFELLENYQLAEYPEHDMTRLSFADGSYDLVVHSDTLEHVPEPVLGLKECSRLLAPGGSCIFTIPMIIGRMSTDRKGKKMSYHGSVVTSAGDWAVQTEYGADAWTDCIKAGFSSVAIHCLEYPSAFAFECRNSI